MKFTRCYQNQVLWSDQAKKEVLSGNKHSRWVKNGVKRNVGYTKKKSKTFYRKPDQHLPQDQVVYVIKYRDAQSYSAGCGNFCGSYGQKAPSHHPGKEQRAALYQRKWTPLRLTSSKPFHSWVWKGRSFSLSWPKCWLPTWWRTSTVRWYTNPRLIWVFGTCRCPQPANLGGQGEQWQPNRCLAQLG